MRFLQGLKKGLLPLLILAGALGVFMLLKSTKPTQPPIEIKQKSWAVEVETLQPQALAPMHTLYGQIQSSQMVTVAAPVTGVVARLPFKSGEDFAPGDLLVAMAKADLNLPEQMAQADVSDIEQQIELEKLAAENNLKRLVFDQKLLQLNQEEVTRNRQLLKKDLSSQAVLDQSKSVLIRQQQVVDSAQLKVAEHQAKLSQLQARLARAQANLQQRQLNQSRGRLKADFRGRVAERLVAEGSHVNQGTALMRFYPLDSLELRAKLPSSQRQAVSQDLQSQQSLYAELEKQGQRYQLPLRRLAGESETSGIDAFFELPDALTILRPGDMLEVQFYQPPVQGVFAAPVTAVYGRDRVYVVQQGQLQMRKVKVVGDSVIAGTIRYLLQGDLQAGEQLLVTHLPNAISGLKVTVMAE